MVMFNIRSDAEFKGGSVIFDDGNTYPFSADHPNYKAIVKALMGGEENEDVLFKLVAPFDAIFKNLTSLSDRVSRKGMVLYFDGDPINSAIAQRIIKSVDEEGYEGGKVWPSYVNFLERLMTNPSPESRDHFYKYVESHDLTITPEGLVILYKGVRATDKPGQYTSTVAGPGVVQFPDGHIEEFEKEYLPNGVGYVVSIPRSMVDDNRRVDCSTGLHAGTYDYATGVMRTGHLLTVLVDPRDVVSVPADHGNAKVRVSRYTVLEVNTKDKAYKAGVHTPTAKVPAKPKAAPVKSVKVTKPSATAKINVKAAGTTDAKVAEFEKAIKALVKADRKINLSRYKNKRITAGQRANFKKAAENLGYQA